MESAGELYCLVKIYDAWQWRWCHPVVTMCCCVWCLDPLFFYTYGIYRQKIGLKRQFENGSDNKIINNDTASAICWLYQHWFK